MNALLANDILHKQKHSEQGCTIPFFETKKISCSTKIEEKTPNNKSKRKEQLYTILDNVKKYKEKNEQEKKKLKQELKALKEAFKHYKAKKHKELKELKGQLKIIKKKLSKNKKKLRLLQKKHKSISKKVVKKKIIKKKVVKKKIIKKKVFPKKVVQQVTIKPLPPVNNLPWVEIIVENNLNIYQLALKYYGDRERYKEIYSANRHIIGKNLKLHDGMSLRIPMTNQFEEQPMILNTQ
jgi:hypothetical protein